MRAHFGVDGDSEKCVCSHWCALIETFLFTSRGYVTGVVRDPEACVWCGWGMGPHCFFPRVIIKDRDRARGSWAGMETLKRFLQLRWKLRSIYSSYSLDQKAFPPLTSDCSSTTPDPTSPNLAGERLVRRRQEHNDFLSLGPLCAPRCPNPSPYLILPRTLWGGHCLFILLLGKWRFTEVQSHSWRKTMGK